MCYRVILLALTLLSLAYADQTVTVTARGISEEHARNEALRMAVEQVAGVKIFSSTEVENFIAIKDAIITESFGLVTSYKILSTKKVSKKPVEYEVTMEATVTQNVASEWQRMQVILRQKGRPTIMFCLRETLDGMDTAENTGEAELVTHFLKLGFEVVDRRHFEDTRELHKQLKSLEGEHNALIAIASDHGADLVVYGTLEAMYKGVEDLYVPCWSHNYILTARIVRTDTNITINSLTENYLRAYQQMTTSREAAGRFGFKDLVKEDFLQKFVSELVRFWITEGDTGTMIKVTITEVQRKVGKRIQQALSEQPGIKSIEYEDYIKRRYTMKVYTILSADDLCDVLEDLPDYPIEVEESTKNKIEASYCGGEE